MHKSTFTQFQRVHSNFRLHLQNLVKDWIETGKSKTFWKYFNIYLLDIETINEVKDTIAASNLPAAPHPGTDGITSLFYNVCWNVMGDPLTEVIQAINEGSQPTFSMYFMYSAKTWIYMQFWINIQNIAVSSFFISQRAVKSWIIANPSGNWYE